MSEEQEPDEKTLEEYGRELQTNPKLFDKLIGKDVKRYAEERTGERVLSVRLDWINLAGRSVPPALRGEITYDTPETNSNLKKGRKYLRRDFFIREDHDTGEIELELPYPNHDYKTSVALVSIKSGKSLRKLLTRDYATTGRLPTDTDYMWPEASEIAREIKKRSLIDLNRFSVKYEKAGLRLVQTPEIQLE